MKAKDPQKKGKQTIEHKKWKWKHLFCGSVFVKMYFNITEMLNKMKREAVP